MAGLALLVTWDLYLNPKLTEIQVLVASRPILADTTITSQDVATETILRTDAVSGAINTASALVGKTATQHIGPGEPFATYMISQQGLVPNGRYSTYVIPHAWLFAVPAIVRRGDHLNFYAVAGNSFHGVPLTHVGQPLLTGVRVEYALDSAGQEVVNANPSVGATSAQNRQNSTGTIAELDVLLTKQQWKVLAQTCAAGQQLMVSDLNG